MKRENSQIRLKRIMEERGLRQVDIMKLSEPWQKKLGIKMSKNYLSQYVNGKSNPDQSKLVLLSKTLGVSEPWLMGFDVPRTESSLEVSETKQSFIIETVRIMKQLTKNEQEQVVKFAKSDLDETIINTVEIMMNSDERLKKQIYRYAKLEYSEYEKEQGLKNEDNRNSAS